MDLCTQDQNFSEPKLHLWLLAFLTCTPLLTQEAWEWYYWRSQDLWCKKSFWFLPNQEKPEITPKYRNTVLGDFWTSNTKIFLSLVRDYHKASKWLFRTLLFFSHLALTIGRNEYKFMVTWLFQNRLGVVCWHGIKYLVCAAACILMSISEKQACVKS